MTMDITLVDALCGFKVVFTHLDDYFKDRFGELRDEYGNDISDIEKYIESWLEKERLEGGIIYEMRQENPGWFQRPPTPDEDDLLEEALGWVREEDVLKRKKGGKRKKKSRKRNKKNKKGGTRKKYKYYFNEYI